MSGGATGRSRPVGGTSGIARLWPAAALAAALGCGRGAPEPSDAPALGFGCAQGFDLLLVTLDTTRADRIGCYGGRASTPTIDSLAASGARFDQAIAPVPLTLPSHATVLTGLEPPAHGVRNNGTFVLAEERETLAERLRAEGYATGAFVGAYVLDARYGLAQGFERYDDEVPEGSAREGGHYNERPAAAVTDAAQAWWRELGDGPRFTWVHYYDPHAPYAPPPGGPPGYEGELTYADRELGRLLSSLAPERLARTLVVVTADHGESLGEHGESTHGLLVYETTLRVPLVVSCPTLFHQPAVVRNRLAGLVDIAPTALALLGLPAGAAEGGANLFDPALDADRALWFECLATKLDHGWAPLVGVRRLRDKWIDAPRPEYYALEKDPLERRNLAAEAEGARELAERFAARRAAFGEVEDAVERELDPEEARRLAALGYARTGRAGEGGGEDPKDVIALWEQMARAQELSDAGDDARALALVEKALRRTRTDAYVWETAYVVHVRRRDYARAEAAAREMVALRPTADGYVRLAQLVIRRGDSIEGDALLDRALELDPASGAAYVTRGDRLRLEDRLDEARAAWRRALEVDPIRSGPKARERLADAGDPR